MRAADRSLDVIAFVSEHFREIIRRRLSELTGLALITLALLGALALATWSVQDPSLSHATQKPIHNLLGYPGAIFSDLAMQLLGLAAILLLVPEALLGWRLLAHKTFGEKWRSLFWILATFLGAAFASTLPHIGSWPLPTGLGGVAGDAVLRLPAMLFGAPLGGLTRFVLCVVFALTTAVTLWVACGGRSQAKKSVARDLDEGDEEEFEDEEAGEDRGSAWLGMIVHALLSWKARIGRMIRGEARARTSRVSTATALPPHMMMTTKMRTLNRRPAAALPRVRLPAVPAAATCCPRSISWRHRARASERPCRAKSSTEMLWHSRACCRISEYVGKSSMRGPGRWSPSTNLSPRPASNRHA
jgi:S-DNA-T family DNA segregation ATPase FtsK/SpoIIIE